MYPCIRDFGIVEFVNHGQVSRGGNGVMSPSHRAARDWLAAKLGMPPMSTAGMSDSEIAASERARQEAEGAFAVLTAIAQIYRDRLKAHPEIQQWIVKKYGIREATIDDLRIGWADERNLFPILQSKGFDPKTILSSGAFTIDSQDNPHPFFDRRVVFPYWSSGRVVYLIGRRTPWSSESEHEMAKYKKLPIRNDRTHIYVARAIDNSVLFGEDVLKTHPENVILTEGVTDAIAAAQAGFPTISPVTVRLRKEDVDRVAKRLRGTKTVYLVHDEELSGIGLDAALDTARALGNEQITCKIATIPLGEPQKKARAEFDTLIGAAAAAEYSRTPALKRSVLLKKILANEPEKIKIAERLAGDAKIDVAEWFAAGGTAEDFKLILDAAREPIEVAIDLAPKVEDQVKQVELLEPILRQLGNLRPAAKDKAIKRLRERTGLSLAVLKSEASASSKKANQEDKQRNRHNKNWKDKNADHGENNSNGAVATTAAARSEGSCRRIVEDEIARAKATQDAPQWEHIAEQVYNWFTESGASFFRTRDGEPSMFWENEVFVMSGSSNGPKRRFEGMMYRMTGLVPTSTGTRTFYTVLSALASDRGEVRDQFFWLHTDVKKKIVYLNLNNDRHELVRICPEGVKVVPNGNNEDGVILRGDAKFSGVDWSENTDPADLDELLTSVMGRHMACSWPERQAILDWMCCFPLIEFCGTRPMVRLEGPSGSGKTWAAKMLTSIVFGSDAQKKSTDAANYVDAARNPLIALDNVETGNVTSALLDFLLTSVTGITREKRASGSDSGIVQEKPLCLVLSTGVEALAGELEEIMSRSIVIEFSKDLQDEAMLEGQLLADIRAARSVLLSCLFRRISLILDCMSRGGHERAVKLLRKELGDHGKRRCDEYLALMYLHRVVAAGRHREDELLEEADPAFISIIRRLDMATDNIQRDASPIATGLIGLFGLLGSQKLTATTAGLDMDDSKTIIRDAAPTRLFLALKHAAKEIGWLFPYKNPVQFGRRLSASMPLLESQGFAVNSRKNRHRTNLYTIQFSGRTGATSIEGAPEQTIAGSNGDGSIQAQLSGFDQSFAQA